MKYIVTGGAGFIGSNLVDFLVKEDHDVEVIDNFCSGKRENCNSNVIYHKLDIADLSSIKSFIKIMSNADGVFHAAALPRVQESIEEPVIYENNNTIGTLNMLKCASDANVKKFVYSASSAVYGNKVNMPCKETDRINPMSPYALQKYYGELQSELFSHLYNIETVSLRYFNVYGERQNIDGAYATVMGIFAYQKMNNLPMTIRGDGNQSRDFTYVGDIVRANYAAMNSVKVGNGEVINIGSGAELSVNQIADMIDGEKIYVDPVIEPRRSLASIAKAKELLDWEPETNIKDWIPIYKKSLGI